MGTHAHRTGRTVRKALERGPRGKRGSAYVAKMETRLEPLGAKLHELRAAGSETWDAVKARVESAWNELEAALEKLRS